MKCSIESCPHNRTQGAHIKKRTDFVSTQDDRTDNIIQLCASHHDLFDQGLIGIDQKNNRFITIEKGKPLILQSRINLKIFRKEYVDDKNSHCEYRIRLWLGIVPGAQYAKIL